MPSMSRTSCATTGYRVVSATYGRSGSGSPLSGLQVNTTSSQNPTSPLSKLQQEQLRKLRTFYIKVARLTVNHDVIDDSAVVFASALGKALAEVDPDWHKKIKAPVV